MLIRHSPDAQPYALIFHTGFQTVRLILVQGSRVIKEIVEENKKISKTLICHIDALLKEWRLQLHDIAYIAATIGPAPLTTLRSTLATINGIAAASGVPLYGLSMLDILCHDVSVAKDQACLVILDAFSNEVHYRVYQEGALLLQGMSSIENLAKYLADLPNKQYVIKGEQASLYKKQLDFLSNTIEFLVPKEPDITSNFLAQTSFDLFQNQPAVPQLFPIYLKPAVFSGK